MTAELSDLEADLSQLRARAEAIAQSTQPRVDEDRSWIAKLTLRLFAGSILIVLVATPVLALWQGALWVEVSKAMLAVVAQVLLPVVTLVIGFYFRNEQR